jgi:hypothetical protein
MGFRSVDVGDADPVAAVLEGVAVKDAVRGAAAAEGKVR